MHKPQTNIKLLVVINENKYILQIFFQLYIIIYTVLKKNIYLILSLYYYKA